MKMRLFNLSKFRYVHFIWYMKSSMNNLIKIRVFSASITSGIWIFYTIPIVFLTQVMNYLHYSIKIGNRILTPEIRKGKNRAFDISLRISLLKNKNNNNEPIK